MALKRRFIRSARWFEESAEFFEISEDQLITAMTVPPDGDQEALEKFLEARELILARFMPPESLALYKKVRDAKPSEINDFERSASWKDYILLCLASDRRGFQKIGFYDHLIECLIGPLLEDRRHLDILDYGCGSSLFTRILCEDFPDRVTTTSADVCRYSVDLVRARNRLYASSAQAILIEDVHSLPSFGQMDFILADTVFEHLPNSRVQVQGLVQALKPGGILVENYAGDPHEDPHKSDTVDARRYRTENLERMSSQLDLIYGSLPAKSGDQYVDDGSNRYWMKPGGADSLRSSIDRRLSSERKLIPRVSRFLRKKARKLKEKIQR